MNPVVWMVKGIPTRREHRQSSTGVVETILDIVYACVSGALCVVWGRECGRRHLYLYNGCFPVASVLIGRGISGGPPTATDVTVEVSHFGCVDVLTLGTTFYALCTCITLLRLLLPTSPCADTLAAACLQCGVPVFGVLLTVLCGSASVFHVTLVACASSVAGRWAVVERAVWRRDSTRTGPRRGGSRFSRVTRGREWYTPSAQNEGFTEDSECGAAAGMVGLELPSVHLAANDTKSTPDLTLPPMSDGAVLTPEVPQPSDSGVLKMDACVTLIDATETMPHVRTHTRGLRKVAKTLCQVLVRAEGCLRGSRGACGRKNKTTHSAERIVVLWALIVWGSIGWQLFTAGPSFGPMCVFGVHIVGVLSTLVAGRMFLLSPDDPQFQSDLAGFLWFFLWLVGCMVPLQFSWEWMMRL